MTSVPHHHHYQQQQQQQQQKKKQQQQQQQYLSSDWLLASASLAASSLAATTTTTTSSSTSPFLAAQRPVAVGTFHSNVRASRSNSRSNHHLSSTAKKTMTTVLFQPHVETVTVSDHDDTSSSSSSSSAVASPNNNNNNNDDDDNSSQEDGYDTAVEEEDDIVADNNNDDDDDAIDDDDDHDEEEEEKDHEQEKDNRDDKDSAEVAHFNNNSTKRTTTTTTTSTTAAAATTTSFSSPTTDELQAQMNAVRDRLRLTQVHASTHPWKPVQTETSCRPTGMVLPRTRLSATSNRHHHQHHHRMGYNMYNARRSSNHSNSQTAAAAAAAASALAAPSSASRLATNGRFQWTTTAGTAEATVSSSPFQPMTRPADGPENSPWTADVPARIVSPSPPRTHPVTSSSSSSSSQSPSLLFFQSAPFVSPSMYPDLDDNDRSSYQLRRENDHDDDDENHYSEDCSSCRKGAPTSVSTVELDWFAPRNRDDVPQTAATAAAALSAPTLLERHLTKHSQGKVQPVQTSHSSAPSKQANIHSTSSQRNSNRRRHNQQQAGRNDCDDDDASVSTCFSNILLVSPEFFGEAAPPAVSITQRSATSVTKLNDSMLHPKVTALPLEDEHDNDKPNNNSNNNNNIEQRNVALADMIHPINMSIFNEEHDEAIDHYVPSTRTVRESQLCCFEETSQHDDDDDDEDDDNGNDNNGHGVIVGADQPDLMDDNVSLLSTSNRSMRSTHSTLSRASLKQFRKLFAQKHATNGTDGSEVQSHRTARTSSSFASTAWKKKIRRQHEPAEEEEAAVAASLNNSMLSDLSSSTVEGGPEPSQSVVSGPGKQNQGVTPARQRKPRDRIAYRLGLGRQGMSQQDRAISQQLLPRQPFVELTNQENVAASSVSKNALSSQKNSAVADAILAQEQPHKPRYPACIYVLLLETKRKLFEVCAVDFVPDLTVGDVLAKVRTKATDSALSNQLYVSLMNAMDEPDDVASVELAAPMLPVLHLVPTLAQSSPMSSSSPRLPVLLTAVPEHSTAATCRRITKSLLKNERVKKWLEQTDPFQVPTTTTTKVPVSITATTKKTVSSSQSLPPPSRSLQRVTNNKEQSRIVPQAKKEKIMHADSDTGSVSSLSSCGSQGSRFSVQSMASHRERWSRRFRQQQESRRNSNSSTKSCSSTSTGPSSTQIPAPRANNSASGSTRKMMGKPRVSFLQPKTASFLSRNKTPTRPSSASSKRTEAATLGDFLFQTASLAD